VPGDGEDGGDGVEGEDDVGEFDGDEGEEEDRNHAGAVFVDEETVLTKADGMNAGEPVDPSGGVGFVLLFFREDEADGGEEENGGEDVADPVKTGEETDPGGDEGSAHEDGAGDSPEKNLGLVGWFDLEGTEEEEEDEEVIDGERLFDGVAGKILGGGLAAKGFEDEDGEGERGTDPEDGGGNRGGVDLFRALVTDVNQLDRKEHDDADVETDPVTERGGAEHPVWMLQAEAGGCTAARVSPGMAGEEVAGWNWLVYLAATTKE